MRVGFPVIFIRNGVEYAGITCTSSAKEDRPAADTIVPVEQLGELRCSIAFYDPAIRGWRQADDVPYLGIHLPVPAEGDFYSEVGAPDPVERAAEAADREARMKRALEDPLPEGARSPDPVDEQPATSAELSLEESINEGLEAEARDRAEARMDAEAPAAAARS